MYLNASKQIHCGLPIGWSMRCFPSLALSSLRSNVRAPSLLLLLSLPTALTFFYRVTLSKRLRRRSPRQL